jgi:hypothetical protein
LGVAMTLAGTYIVYGIVYDALSAISVGAVVTIVDITNNQGIKSFTTSDDGYYQINIEDIASDGDDILVEVTLPSGHVYGECFTLNLYDKPKNIDLNVSEYSFLTISSDTYTVKLRYCTIDELKRNLTKNVDVLNFWTDDVEAVDRDLNSEPLTFIGIEFAETDKEVCYIGKKFERIWNIQDNDEEITINQLGDCFDSVYVIKSFTFDSIKKAKNAYIWRLQLERVREL